MVRKVISMLAILCLLCAFGTVAQAASYTAYDGNPSNTYIQYFKDTLGSIPLSDNYVAFRAEQNKYIMAVGDLTYSNGVFSGDVDVYIIQSDNSYNGYYSYGVSHDNSFKLTANDKIIYSDLGNYPQLEERGAKYEVLTTILIVAICVGYVCRSIFHYRPR